MRVVKFSHVLVLVVLSALIILAAACSEGNRKETPTHSPPPAAGSIPAATAFVPEVPSSFTEMPTAEDVERFRSAVRNALTENRPLHSLFRRVSASPEMSAALALKPTDVVADIGCGTGGFQMYMLEKSVPFAKMYAVDIDLAAIDFLRFMLKESELPGNEKIVPVHSTMADVHLPPDSIDVMLVLNTPFYNSMMNNLSPVGDAAADCMQSMRRAMKTGGRLHVLESQRRDLRDAFPIITGAFTAAGFKFEKKELLTIPVENGGVAPHFHVVFVN